MTERIIGPQGSKRRRRFLWVPALGIVCLALFAIGSAQAVQDLVFQLDGNATASLCGTTPDGNCSTQSNDWDSIFTSSGTVVGSLPANFLDAKFIRDFSSKKGKNGACSLTSTDTTFCTTDSTTYATGSKDTLPIATGWQCNTDNNVNSKIDIMNAYVTRYADPISHDTIMYFGMDKNKDNGDNNVGFWFLQGTAGCTSPASGAGTFTGSHHNNDVLVTSEFTSGGGVSSIDVFRWAGGAGGCIDSFDNPDPHVRNPDGSSGCNQQPIGSGGDCKTAAIPEPDICATTNSGTHATFGNITTPWLTADATLGVGHTVVPPDFFEGAIDLDRAFNSAGGGGAAPSCFNTFLGDTRSSQQPTATLFDYALGQLGECHASLSTTASRNGTSTEIAANGTISSGTDSAELKITGTSTWGGTLTWYLCGPDVTTCDTSGYQVQSQTVANTDNSGCGADCTYATTAANAVPLTAAGVPTTADPAGGEYCWHAQFVPNQATKDAGLTDNQDDDGTGECFFVTPKTPTLSTSATCSATPCVLGSTLNDTAQLTGTARNPDPLNPGTNSTYPTINGGTKAADSTITWAVYGPDSSNAAQCTTPISGAPTPSSVTVSGDSTALNPYGPVSYVTQSTDRVGPYEFSASYGGDGPNTLAATAVGCDTTGGNHEQVTVTGAATSSSAQRWLPNDRVVLGSTAGTTLHGTLTVTLYKGSFSGTAANCTAGTATAVSGQQYSTSVSTASNSFSYNTTNSTFVVGTNSDGTTTGAGTDGTYFWLIHYVDNSLTSPSDRCETSTMSHNDG